jgi:hypothetical protein
MEQPWGWVVYYETLDETFSEGEFSQGEDVNPGPKKVEKT